MDDPVGGGPASGSPAPSRASQRPASMVQRRIAWRPLLIAAVSTVVFFTAARPDRRQRARLARGEGLVLQRQGLRRVLAAHPRGVLGQHPAVRHRRAAGPAAVRWWSPSSAARRDRSSSRSASWRPSTSTSSGRCPGILVIFILGFGMPALGLPGLPTDQRSLRGSSSLTLIYSAYVSEVYRAGIDSVHPSQGAAARSLGLSHLQALRFVILPQAVRRVIPPLLNDFIGLQKDTRPGVVHRRRRDLPPVADPPGRLVQLHALHGDRPDLHRGRRSPSPGSSTGWSPGTGGATRRAPDDDDGRPGRRPPCGSRACTRPSGISRSCAGSTSSSRRTRSSA